ncbi:tetratricopeptide repeat protein 38 family protein [Cupriavidus pauculus]|uniref:Tetratricopeptide repeat protein 38 n=1 Tax=Cupriavidus pauculus TaxID=82633 RepID=A0A2N5CDC3_9BURK|nr:tetratricopeptide repeat protein 38 family protein [Cupriavidus pauculus]PLQ00240.1 tetratricopeptide repeat protein 38 family protein [Cupriavidus pauculus]
MPEDRFGLNLSTTSNAARDAYVAGVDSVMAGVAGYREHLAESLRHDPSFALATIALARGRFLDGEIAVGRELAAAARDQVARHSPRERSHVNVLALSIEGKPGEAMRAMHEHVENWPRDGMVVAPATSVFGLYGFSGDPDHEEKLYQFLSSLASAYGHDWWFDAVLGFAACETGRLDEAWTLLNRALAANPRHAHAAHFRAHVMYERGESAAILEFLDAWLPDHDPRSLTHCHISWHVALAALALGKLDRAWDAYRRGVRPGAAWGPPINVVTDGVSFLWRAELAGSPRDEDAWRELHAHALRCYPKAGLGYADAHALIACVVSEDIASLQGRIAEISERLEAQSYPAGESVTRIAEGFAAYAAGDWDAAIHALQAAWPLTVRIGGSRAQRDLVALTLVAAYLKAGRPDAARTMIEKQQDRSMAIVVDGYS